MNALIVFALIGAWLLGTRVRVAALVAFEWRTEKEHRPTITTASLHGLCAGDRLEISGETWRVRAVRDGHAVVVDKPFPWIRVLRTIAGLA